MGKKLLISKDFEEVVFMGPSQDSLIDLTNAVYSKLGEASELAERWEAAAQNTPEREQVMRMVVKIKRLQREAAELRHRLVNQ